MIAVGSDGRELPAVDRGDQFAGRLTDAAEGSNVGHGYAFGVGRGCCVRTYSVTGFPPIKCS